MWAWRSRTALRLATGVVSVALLLALAFLFLRGAWAAAQAAGDATPAPSRFDGSRASYLLGVTMALTGPWNVAFWLAVVGRPEGGLWRGLAAGVGGRCARRRSDLGHVVVGVRPGLFNADQISL